MQDILVRRLVDDQLKERFSLSDMLELYSLEVSLVPVAVTDGGKLKVRTEARIVERPSE